MHYIILYLLFIMYTRARACARYLRSIYTVSLLKKWNDKVARVTSATPFYFDTRIYYASFACGPKHLTYVLSVPGMEAKAPALEGRKMKATTAFANPVYYGIATAGFLFQTSSATSYLKGDILRRNRGPMERNKAQGSISRKREEFRSNDF